MAFLRKIWPRRCVVCKKQATVELVNRYNASLGDYCGVCGRRALVAQAALEMRQPNGEG